MPLLEVWWPLFHQGMPPALPNPPGVLETEPSKIIVISPADGQVLGDVPALAASEVAAAVERARDFQGEWAGVPWEERARMLDRARGILIRRSEEMARLIAREQGKPVTEGLTAEVLSTLDTLKFLVHETPALLETIPMPHRLPVLADKSTRCVMTPAGVTSVLSAWNYPFAIPMCQIATSLAAGNATVFRPSSTTPLVGLAIGEILREAGVPEAALQVVTCQSSVAETLVTHPAVRLVLFTGSNAVGERVMALAARGPKRVVLELGGKDPFLVFADADLPRAANAAVWGAFMNCGQTCSSVERVYVHESVLEPFTQGVLRAVAALKVGDPLDPDTEVGPMTTEDGVRKMEEHVAEAVAKGARVLAGGRRLQGRFFEPTVLVDVTHEMKVMTDETFGPILPIMPFSTEAEAVALANDTPYGLTASVFTRNRLLARRVSSGIEAGVVTVNDVNFTFGAAEAPWGGVKATGLGRTHGRFGLQEMVQVKCISEDWTSRPHQLWWYPYDAAAYRFFTTAMGALFAPHLGGRVAGLVRLMGHLPRLNRDANLPAILARVPDMVID